MGELIKTRANYLETGLELGQKRRPVVQLSANAPTNGIPREQLPNTIRVSIDSGRDNPFRPDGPIYRSVDPIVDFYRTTPSSRPQSRAEEPESAESPANGEQKQPASHDQSTTPSCWWQLFCCGCCRRHRSKTRPNPTIVIGKQA